VVASRTAPVLEVVEDGVDARLVDFFDAPALADAVAAALADAPARAGLGAAARRTVQQRFDRQRICLPRALALLHRVAARG